MKILHLLETARAESGGPIAVASSLGHAWARAGHRQDLVTLDLPGEADLGDYPGELIALGAPRRKTPSGIYRYSPDLVPWLHAHARSYDAVIVSSLWRYQARAAITGLHRIGVPYSVFTHGMLDPWFERYYPVKHWLKQLSWWMVEGAYLRHAQNVLFTCREEMLQAQDAFWPYHVRGAVAGCGTLDVPEAEDRASHQRQIEAFHGALPAVKGKRYLLFLSRLHEKKGCDILIDAFGAVAAEDPELHLVVAGPDQVGLRSALETQARDLGLAGRVHFPGMVTGDVKFGAYRAAQAFALTSHQENFGVVVAEALACGTPVLLGNEVNVWREVVDAGAGLATQDNAPAAAMLARFLAMPPAALAAMRAATRPCFLDRFHIDRAAANLLSILMADRTAPERNRP
ncbi:glycosyltransferase [Novosphingobium umbonatum]|nr:glycosyltransferase [Novosphingobium umbonatum]